MRIVIRTAVIGVIVAAGLALLFNFDRLTRASLDQALLREKASRYAHFQLGHRLPGTPDLSKLTERLAVVGASAGAPVFMRIFKREFELELWMRTGGSYRLFAVYPICMFSGGLGPKLREGDKQAPEGFYSVGPAQLNPNSSYHRSFNLGYPNAFDRAHGRTGSFLMVHGNCVSAGCYAMTDAVVRELWHLVTMAFRNGQERFPVHVFPFRMTQENMSAHAGSPWSEFWTMLKPAYDLFDAEKVPPRIDVCDGRYVVRSGAAPALVDAVGCVQTARF